MSTPDAENAPLLRTKRSERSSVLSFAKTSGASRLDVFLLCTRVCTTPPWRHPAPRTPCRRYPRLPSTIATLTGPHLRRSSRSHPRRGPRRLRLRRPHPQGARARRPEPSRPFEREKQSHRTPGRSARRAAPRRAAPRSRPRPRAHPDVSPRPSPPPSRGKRRRLTQRNSPNSSHPIPPQPTYPPLFIFAGAPRFRLRLRARRRG